MSHVLNVSPGNPIWVFEENYRLFMRLLPVVLGEGERLTLVSHRADGDLRLRVVEDARYTTTLELSKPFSIDNQWLPDLIMKVRIYYDAEVVEVMGYQGCDRIPPRYQVSRHGRFHRDEKRQVNYLLNDLLRHCLRYDYRLVSDVNA
jgi:uncharacterized protein YqiB (DUF1249 family)